MSLWEMATAAACGNWGISTLEVMKRRKYRLPIPQHEFGFSADAFNLSVETGLDGERITRERGEADHARQVAEAAQAAFFTTPQNHHE